MFDLLREISDWTVGFAESDWAALFLAVSSFSESIFFPIPPDPLLIGIAVLRPEMALWLAAIATVSSVAGGVAGHWLGQRFGRPLLYRLVSPEKVAPAERMFHRYGAWAVLAAAFTPIPFKVFTISAGMLDLDRRSFVLASFVGRGARFFLLGGLLFAFGESVRDFIDRNFELLTIGASIAMAVTFAVAVIIVRLRRGKKAVG